MDFVRPQPRWEAPLLRIVAIRDPELVQIVAARHSVMKPRGVESFLSCPYQFFAQFTLDLRTRPPRPESRLDFRLQGTILHKVLAEAIHRPADLDAIHERVFERECAKQMVMAGYKKEFFRRQTLDDIRRFLDELKLPPAEETLTEWPFQIAMGDGIEVRGRVDRVDRLPGNRALVVDYKRGKFDITKPNLLQGPLYLLAVERGLGLAPAAMLYCSLRRKVALSGWVDPDARLGIAGEPLTREWLRQSEQALSAAAGEIRSGRIEPQPVSTEICRWCDFVDVCRYRGRAAQAARA
jgi:RecB family exonuclease